MRAIYYDILGIVLYGGGFLFLFKAIRFLSGHDYVAAIVCGLIGLLVVRAGSELSKLSLLSSWRSKESKEQ